MNASRFSEGFSSKCAQFNEAGNAGAGNSLFLHERNDPVRPTFSSIRNRNQVTDTSPNAAVAKGLYLRMNCQHRRSHVSFVSGLNYCTAQTSRPPNEAACSAVCGRERTFRCE